MNTEIRSDNFSCILKNIAFVLVFTVAIDIFLSSLLFICNCSITVFNFFISIIISVILCFIINSDCIKDKIISCLIAIVILFFSIFISEKVYDFSYDGNAYHKNAVAMLKNGWNPIYQDSADIRVKLVPKKYKDVSSIWVDHYAKGNWIFGASVYKVTGNIESAKSINILLICALFCFSFYYIFNKSHKMIFSFILSFMLTIMPINFIQMFSLYNDGTIYSTLTLFVISLLIFCDEKEKHKISTWCWLFGTLFILINIKFTGLAYVGIYSLGFALYYIYLHRDNIKRIFHSACIFMIMILISVLIGGSTSYVKNFIVHGHPFYPLYGDDPVDIITNLQPRNFAYKNSIEKLFLSLFSETDNIWSGVDRDTKLKIPFNVSENEKKEIGIDTRVAGFGPLFSGILLVSILVIVIGVFKCAKNKQIDCCMNFIVLLVITGMSILLMPDSWWARYAPQLYYFPVVALAFLMFIIFKKSFIKYVVSFTFFILVFKNLSYSFDFIQKNISDSVILQNHFNDIHNTTIDVATVSDNFVSQLFNLRDSDIDYKIVNYKKKYKILYYPGLVYKNEK